MMMYGGWLGAILLILLVIILLRLNKNQGVSNKENSRNNKSEALSILKDRFARGEISESEFETKKATLKEN